MSDVPAADQGSAPLEGIRVLDLSRVLAGPWVGQSLADLGADVIKVERPGTGDDTRAWGPPFIQTPEGENTGESAYYMATNRGKRSLAIDMTQQEGQKILREIARKSDIVIENFKVGGLEKYGLDYQSLSAINPRLVYCSITGFGQTGPYAEKAGYDLMIQGMGGLMSITGEADRQPMKVGVAVVDVFSGMYGLSAILAALFKRERSGKGDHIDIALMDCQTAMLANQATNYLVSGKIPKRRGNAHPNISPYEVFETGDGYMILAVGNDRQFVEFCNVAGAGDLALDKRFSTNSLRVENREALVPMVAKILRQKTTEYWVSSLESASVPAGPINDLSQVFADPHLKQRGILKNYQHPSGAMQDLVSTPMRFSQSRSGAERPPPMLGQHTDEVLEELLQTSREDIAKLRQLGAIA
ncbi:CaiB/BaiF CoA-transferase family protein [Kiloniella laminariae]|uniref:CaiB/BaiF CoA-transferase family protein n=1 Tax=Kiloniella laminariae TaxID=454162 RepID=A0ABT4LPF6_9PROT|nr:CaiB/BaiF CoA-transferase family protein [Kiloniella laminariae]MCZ4282780.1 CaiB/BaiF CoA-transferase family protein [Kiloniella laminariae]